MASSRSMRAFRWPQHNTCTRMHGVFLFFSHGERGVQAIATNMQALYSAFLFLIDFRLGSDSAYK